MIYSHNYNSSFQYNVNRNNEFFEYDDDFVYECSLDDLANEDWDAPQPRNKRRVLSERNLEKLKARSQYVY